MPLGWWSPMPAATTGLRGLSWGGSGTVAGAKSVDGHGLCSAVALRDLVFPNRVQN